jgi:hypothetical protein
VSRGIGDPWIRCRRQPSGADSCFVVPRPQETQLWKDREARNSFRLSNLDYHMAAVPKFTEVGFKVEKTPPQLWAKIKDFYLKNRHKVGPALLS